MTRIFENPDAPDAPPPLPDGTVSAPAASEMAAPAAPLAKVRLPNATGGKAYRAAIDLASHDMPDLRIADIEGVAELGLTFDVERQTLTGTPVGSSETRELALDARLATASGLQLEGTAKILLLINPDPRSLWKDIAPDETAPFPKPNRASQQVTFGDRIALGASVRGRSHANVGSFREDDFHIAHDAESGWLVLTVSDGAGSAKLSREGSRLATTHAATTLMAGIQALTPTIAALPATPPDEATLKALHDQALEALGRAAHDACRAINDTAKAVEASEKDFASTLLIAAVRPCPAGTFIASYWVGDGALAVYHESAVDVLGDGDSGEFSGQTRFLMASELNKGWSEISRRVRVRVVPELTALALMSDGVSDPKFGTDRRLRDPEAWGTFWNDDLALTLGDRFSPGLEARLLSWLEFWSPGEHDDRTLVLLF